MTDEEFERARGKMVAAAKEMAAKLPDPLARERQAASTPSVTPKTLPKPRKLSAESCSARRHDYPKMTRNPREKDRS